MIFMMNLTQVKKTKNKNNKKKQNKTKTKPQLYVTSVHYKK